MVVCSKTQYVYIHGFKTSRGCRTVACWICISRHGESREVSRKLGCPVGNNLLQRQETVFVVPSQ